MKTKRLQRELKRPLFQIVGILESLWQIAIDSADEGEIGKFDNEEIAAAIEWDGDPEDLIHALVVSRWLDEDDKHRLVIHDWLEHCADFIKDRVRKRRDRAAKAAKAAAAQESLSEDVRDVPDTKGQSPDKSENVPSLPGPTQPDPVQPSPKKPVTGVLKSGISGTPVNGQKMPLLDLTEADLKDVGRLEQLLRNICRVNPIDGLHLNDRGLLLLVSMAVRALEEGDTPIKMFVSNVHQKRWNTITNEHEKEAESRILEWHRNRRLLVGPRKYA